MAFDTLTYAKNPQEAGVPPQQAETQAWALKETVEDTLATKQDATRAAGCARAGDANGRPVQGS